MPIRLDARDPGFAATFASLVDDRRDSDGDVTATVTAIIADVARRGDVAVFELTEKFDGINLSPQNIAVSDAEVEAACASIENDLMVALEHAAARIRAFHEAQRPADRDATDSDGIRAGWRWSAVDAAGLYVPGGLASYPSSVLMNAIPAKVAGVERLVMVTPTPGGRMNPLVLAAARLAGVDTIYRIGGAQAVAALAFGTASIAPVDKIVGPGNAYVAEAKRQLYGRVGIDMVAGPSEILVVADAANDPAWIAADLMSQAEHDPVAQSILITDDAGFADSVCAEIEALLTRLPNPAVARASWDRFGAVIVVQSLEQAAGLVNALAPEHLQIATDDPQHLFNQVRHAGSVFLGRYTPEAIGDYVGGPNHVLPTGRRARFASGLSVADFMKRTTFLGCSVPGLTVVGPSAIALARAEGLHAHAESVDVRLKELGKR